jgi:hypothetical protein
MILVFAAFTTCYFYLVTKYNALHVWAQPYDSEGHLWPGAFHMMVALWLSR